MYIHFFLSRAKSGSKEVEASPVADAIHQEEKRDSSKVIHGLFQIFLFLCCLLQ